MRNEYKELFERDSVEKQLLITLEDDDVITNKDLYQEEFELKESLCSEQELRFGACEASVIRFKMTNTRASLKDKWFVVSQILGNNPENEFQYGWYKVYSDIPSGDRNYRNVTAYDDMYDILNADVTEWYNSVSFPISLENFRYSFFAYLGIEQERQSLVQDEMMIEKTIETNEISGKMIITAICEINGVFGHMNRDGFFEYVSLENKIKYLHPGNEFYPGAEAYPGMVIDLEYAKHDISSNLYQTCEYEDYETQYITKLQIRQSQNDIGAISGAGTNCYIVEDNFLVYGKSAEELSQICSRLFGQICGVRYRQFKAAVKGNPCYEVGDLINIKAKYKDIQGYILERTLKGIQALKDTFEAKGVYQYAEKVNSVNREVKRLKGKTAILERTVEMLNSTVMDEEKGLKTQIKQTAEQVEVMAGDDYVSSKISVEIGKILLKGNRIAIESDYFTLSEDGKLHAREGIFEGDIITHNAIIQGGNINIAEDEAGSYGNLCIYKDNWETTVASSYISTEADGGSVFLAGEGIIRVYDYDAPTEMIFDVGGGSCEINTDFVYMRYNLEVGGTKKRIVDTENYNTRSLYCYEMPNPIFGDVGHGVVGEDGLCYIDIDQIFFETVDMHQSYQVFLQTYSEHNVFVLEKQSQYFVVKGEPNTEFDWELKAKQSDYPMERLEEKIPQDDYEEVDYIAAASNYLNKCEQEVLSDG